jgi:hypothetical protein
LVDAENIVPALIPRKRGAGAGAGAGSSTVWLGSIGRGLAGAGAGRLVRVVETRGRVLGAGGRAAGFGSGDDEMAVS